MTISRKYMGFILWAVCAGIVVLVFLTLKMFTVNPYAGDENIYVYQAKLVSEGVRPYREFAMAHPPVQAIFAALLFKSAGYNFILFRTIAFFFTCMTAIVLLLITKREIGRTASVFAITFFLWSYEPLRAASHFTGVNMTTFLLVMAVAGMFFKKPLVCAIFCALAVFTRIYAIPIVASIVIWSVISHPKFAKKIIIYGAITGIVFLTATGLWTGFADMFHNLALYHAQKTPMSDVRLAGMKNSILFHNSPIIIFFLSAACVWIIAVFLQLTKNPKAKSFSLRGAFKTVISTHPFVGFCIFTTLIMLITLFSMNRIWMYYFIPAFPFAAVCAGWLLGRMVKGTTKFIIFRFNLNKARISKAHALGWAILGAVIISLWIFSPLLETRLVYYKKEINKPEEERSYTYNWNRGMLFKSYGDLIKKAFWPEKRIIGKSYLAFTYYLWHESRTFDVADSIVLEILSTTGKDDRIFGDSGTVPLLALLSGRKIAANEVDTNIQRYRSGNEDPFLMVKKIDKAKTKIIIVRNRFGVHGLRPLRKLLKNKYREYRRFRTETGRVYLMYKRKEQI